MEINNFGKVKENVYLYARDLEKICENFREILSNQREAISNLKTEFKKKEIFISLIGEYSSGKTSLINSLIGFDVFSTGNLPTTFTINEFRFGQDYDKVELLSAGKIVKEIPIMGTFELNTQELKDMNIDQIKFYTTSNKIPKNIVLMDTPGISSDNELHDKRLFYALRVANAFLVCIDVNQGYITASTKKIIDTLKEAQKNIYIVYTKSDTKPPKELQEVKRRAKENSVLQVKGIAITSAVNKDLYELMGIIQDIEKEADSILTKFFAHKLIEIAESMKSEMELYIKNKSIEIEELDEAIHKYRNEILKLEEKLNKEVKRESQKIWVAEEKALKIFREEADKEIENLTKIVKERNRDELQEKFEKAVRRVIKKSYSAYSLEAENIIKKIDTDVYDILESLKLDVPNFDMPAKFISKTATFMTGVATFSIPFALLPSIALVPILSSIPYISTFQLVINGLIGLKLIDIGKSLGISSLLEKTFYKAGKSVYSFNSNLIRNKLKKNFIELEDQFKSFLDDITKEVIDEIENQYKKNYHISMKKIENSLEKFRIKREKLGESGFESYVKSLENAVEEIREIVEKLKFELHYNIKH